MGHFIAENYGENDVFTDKTGITKYKLMHDNKTVTQLYIFLNNKNETKILLSHNSLHACAAYLM